jgi:hypothetical protein
MVQRLKFTILVGTLYGVAMAQTPVSGGGQEPVFGVQSPYAQMSDPSQSQAQTKTQTHIQSSRSSATAAALGGGKPGSAAEQRGRSMAKAETSQLCFVSGQGYVPRTESGCPAASGKPDAAKAEHAEANEGAAAKPPFDVKTLLSSPNGATALVKDAVKASTPPEERRLNVRKQEAERQERRVPLTNRPARRKPQCEQSTSVLRSQSNSKDQQPCVEKRQPSRYVPESQPSNVPFHRN